MLAGGMPGESSLFPAFKWRNLLHFIAADISNHRSACLIAFESFVQNQPVFHSVVMLNSIKMHKNGVAVMLRHSILGFKKIF